MLLCVIHSAVQDLLIWSLYHSLFLGTFTGSRRELIKKGCGNLLKCIDCGACFNSLNDLAEQNGWKNTMLTAKYVGLQAINGKLQAEKGLDTLADFDCPVGIKADDVRKAF